MPYSDLTDYEPLSPFYRVLARLTLVLYYSFSLILANNAITLSLAPMDQIADKNTCLG